MKRMILMSLFSIIALVVSAQTGWKREYMVDEYTQEKNPICVYYNRLGSVQAIYYINDQRLKVIKDYDGLKRFQVTWDALMNSSGKIESTTGSIYYLLIGTANNQDIEVSDVCVYYSEVDKAGDSFFASFYVEIEPSDLMKANSISFMWWDKIIDDTATKNISLMGFTKAYQHNK